MTTVEQPLSDMSDVPKQTGLHDSALSEEELSRAQASLREQSRAANFISAWDAYDDIVKPETDRYLPHVWRWDVIRPLLAEAEQIVSLDRVDRRGFLMANPGVFPKYFAGANLYAGYQLVAPGETAAVHWHTPSASRFVLEGNGGYTVVEGEKCMMERGDLILTPQGTWHDHGNEGDAPAVWVDVLDLPIIHHLGATYFEFEYFEDDEVSGKPARKRTQTVSVRPDYSTRAYGTAGMLPTFVSHQRGRGKGTSCFVYPWKQTLSALRALADEPGSPFDGIILEYVDPLTGGPVLPTLDFSVQLLRPNEATSFHRHISSTLFTCLEGSGETLVGDTLLTWGRNDTFVVPAWMWHGHRSKEREGETILYGVSDAPIAKKLELYREELGSAEWGC